MVRSNEALFPVLDELGIGFVPFSPMANGFLSGRYDKSVRFEAGDSRSKMAAVLRGWERAELRAAGLAAWNSGGEGRDARTHIPCVDAMQKAVYRAHSQNAQASADA